MEQIYLALRLAFTDHLDPNGLALPVFLDEVFVNWDGFRLDSGFELLKDMAGKRQVFYLPATTGLWINLQVRWTSRL